MPTRALAIVLALISADVVFAGGGRARTLLCKQTCRSTIEACRQETGRFRKCRNQLLRRCKREGLAVCSTPLEMYAVTTSGNDVPDCGDPAAPCRTIQFVVDQRVQAEGAATIKVAAGTFEGATTCPAGTSDVAVVCIINKRITLLGGFSDSNWDTPSGDPAATVIDGQGAGRGILVARGAEVGPEASLVLDGFTIQNGLVTGAAKGELVERSAGGGGLFAVHSPVTLRNVVFRNNEARGGTTTQDEGGWGSGGAISAFTGWPSVPAPMSLQNVTFTGNRATGGGGGEMGGYALGGAIFLFEITLTGDGVVFTDNAATGGPTNGAGTNGVDKADPLGGALAVGLHGVADLRNVRATGNVATGGDAPHGDAGGAFGGAVFLEKSSLVLTDGRLEGNRAQGGNGKNVGPAGSIAQGGALQTLNANLTLDRVVVAGNEARSGNGDVNGGVAQGGGAAMILGAFEGAPREVTIRNSVVADNAISRGTGRPAIGGGGGIFLNGATATIEHSTIAGNRLDHAEDVGGGIAALPVPSWQTHVTVVDSIVANHRHVALTPFSYSNAGLWVAANASADVTRVLFANNLHDSNAGIDDPYNLPPGTFTLAAMWSVANAGFAGPGDYHLMPGSLAVDGAVGSTLTVDLDGNPRPVGSAPDLGAYELQP